MTIRFEDVHLEHAGRPVLRGITADLTEHRIGIIGENGSGKSRWPGRSTTCTPPAGGG